jgi:hypothetical protein
MKLPVPTEVIYTDDLNTLGLAFSDDSSIVLSNCSKTAKLPENLSSITIYFTPDELTIHSLAFTGTNELVIGSKDNLQGRSERFEIGLGEELMGCELHGA